MLVNRKISIAPMMDCTDRHFRYLARLMTRHTLLYTEMVTANAIVHGDRNRHLAFHSLEHPLVLQLGGADPQAMALAAKIAQDFGYDEINLNIGCPSERVRSGQFGVSLMRHATTVAAIVEQIRASVKLNVTVKTRIGVDNDDSYGFLCQFIQTVEQAGCQSFAVHARKAWLNGLSPKQNRSVPPLNYPRVYRLKREFEHLEIIINGGITRYEHVSAHLAKVDGVMVGRQAYQDSYWLSELDRRYYADNHDILSRSEVLARYWEYAKVQAAQGVALPSLVKHALGLFTGMPGAKAWRGFLCEKSRQASGLRDITKAIEKFSVSI